MKNYPSEKFVKAKKRVDSIKGFYKHLKIYIIANVLLLFVKLYVYDFFVIEGVEDQGFLNWLGWNIVLTPILWGIGVFCHGLYVFKFKSISLKELKPRFFKEWEECQIRKYMEEDRDDMEKFE